MSFKALVYAYILGGITFIPLVLFAALFYTVYTSVPVGDPDPQKNVRGTLEKQQDDDGSQAEGDEDAVGTMAEKQAPVDVHDLPKPRKGWLTMRRTFEESITDAGYVNLVRGFLDARSKDPKRSRPKDMWYVVLKGKVLYLYEDEEMTECEAALELGGHDVLIYPENQLDGELFAKRNSICLRPRVPPPDGNMPSVTREMKLSDDSPSIDEQVEQKGGNERKKELERERLEQAAIEREAAREQALNPSTPWFIFMRSNIEMEDWYHALVHASDHPANSPMLAPFQPVFQVDDMAHLVETLDEQPDVIPMRWLNGLLGRLFFSYYRTEYLERYIIGRLMKKIAKVKRPQFLSDIVVKEVSVGNRPPMLSKPMLKELTKEGDAAVEVHMHYKGEIRITVEATATINLGARFKSYTVKLVLAAVLKEMEGNLLIKVKRPPSNRIWYAFTQVPRMVLVVEPIVSDRQITWGMITSSIESRLREVIAESVVLPNMDDIAFFDSVKLTHRGGIWPDAARRVPEQRPDGEKPEGTEASTDLPSEATTHEHAASLDDSSLSRSESPSEVSLDPKSSSAPPETGGLLATATLPGTSPPNKTPIKRRTWLPSSFSPKDEPEVDDEFERGRSTDVQSIGHSRSRSTAEISDSNGTTLAAERASDFLTPSVRRSVSRGSGRSSGLSEFDNALDNFSRAPTSLRTTLSRGSTISDAPLSATSQSTGFFSTLKSRAAAADKQAIANNAKETIKKWGMNWKGLRRGSVGSDDAPDAGDGSDPGEREREASSSQRGRESYANVRAKVEERRVSRNDPASTGASASSPSSAPIPIPNASQRARPTSGSLSPRALSPARVAEPSTSASPNLAQLRPPSPAHSPAPTPIHTQPQPQARTMMIPGIHASHRGEVMSMGYRPPTPPTPATGAPAMDPRARVTSVYNRLWKTGPAALGTTGNGSATGSGGSASATGPASTTNTDTQNALGLADQSPVEHPGGPSEDQHEVPLAPSAPKASPVPPPLPPRTGLAAAALAEIVHRDEESRQATPSADATTNNPVAPPLPPRRPKATA